MKLVCWTILAFALSGCPEQPNEVVTRVPDQGMADAGGDTYVTAEEVSLAVFPVEQGLFSGNVRAEPIEALGDGSEFTAEVGPGVWGVLVNGEPLALGAEAQAADGSLSRVFFNPSTATMSFVVSPSGEVSLTSDRAEVPEQPDAAESLGFGSWFDSQFQQFDGSADPGQVTVELLAAQRLRGGPVETPHGFLFMVAAQPDEPAPQIRGSWNNFEEDPLSTLRPLRPGLWARYIEVPPGRHEYKVYYPSGDTWVTDLGNPNIAWDGFDPGTVGEFNSVLRPSGARMVWLRGVESPQLGNRRDVYVHLPQGYDGGTEEFPALYLHDGNESIVRGRFQLVADELGAEAPVLVFVALPTQDVRMQEYTMGSAGARGDDYVSFVADTLVPRIEAGFRVRTDRASRGLAGASLGGLISFWGTMQRPEVFGYSAGMSSSFFWAENFVVNEMQTRGCQDVRYYLDSGSPNDNHDVTIEMRETLDDLGCDYHYVVEQGGQHDWSYWNGRFGGVLEQFAISHGGQQ